MVQYVADVCAVRYEGDDAHLPSKNWKQQRGHLVDSDDQHRPEIVRRALGWNRLGRLSLGWEWVAYPKFLRQMYERAKHKAPDGFPPGAFVL